MKGRGKIGPCLLVFFQRTAGGWEGVGEDRLLVFAEGPLMGADTGRGSIGRKLAEVTSCPINVNTPQADNHPQDMAMHFVTACHRFVLLPHSTLTSS